MAANIIIIIGLVLAALGRERQLRRLGARLAALERALEQGLEPEADKQAALYTAGLSNILGYGGPLGDRKERVG